MYFLINFYLFLEMKNCMSPPQQPPKLQRSYTLTDEDRDQDHSLLSDRNAKGYLPEEDWDLGQTKGQLLLHQLSNQSITTIMIRTITTIITITMMTSQNLVKLPPLLLLVPRLPLLLVEGDLVADQEVEEEDQVLEEDLVVEEHEEDPVLEVVEESKPPQQRKLLNMTIIMMMITLIMMMQNMMLMIKPIVQMMIITELLVIRENLFLNLQTIQ